MPRKLKYKDRPEAVKDLDRMRSMLYQRKLKNTKDPRYCRSKSADVSRRAGLKHGFNMTPEEYAFMLAVQNGVCAICLRPERIKKSKGNQVPKLLAVDHAHGTTRIRGLLCHSCNIALGLFEDDLILLDAAMRYLRAND